MKKVIGVIFLICVFSLVVWAGVQVKSWYTKQYRIRIEIGQRMIIVDETHTQVRVYPKTAKVFDTGRLKKILSGVLTEK